MKKNIIFSIMILLAANCAFASQENYETNQNKLTKQPDKFTIETQTRLTNEEIAKNTIGVYKLEIEPLEAEIKHTMGNSIKSALTNAGYKIISIELESTQNSDMARGHIKVSKEIKSKNSSYNEIQNNLLEVQQICVKAATFNGKCHLEDMTTFKVVNPKNSHSYAKTLLK